MGMRGYRVLTTEQESRLREQLESLWSVTDTVTGDYKYTGLQIAKALGFGTSEIPDNPYGLLEPERIYFYRKKLGLPVRRKSRGYPHRYKYGRQEEPIDLGDMIKKIEKIPSKDFINCRKRAGCGMGFWGGFRNTENINLIRDDFDYDKDPDGNEVLRVSAFRLKKGRLVTREKATYSIELMLDWMFVKEMADWIERFDPTERPWNVTRQTWWDWHKKVLGKKFYPHYQRLNRITFFCSDPRFSIAEIHNWTGLHLVTIEEYISKSRRFSITATQKMNEFMFEKT